MIPVEEHSSPGEAELEERPILCRLYGLDESEETLRFIFHELGFDEGFKYERNIWEGTGEVVREKGE